MEYHCKKCNDTGFVTFWHNGVEYAKPCNCYKARKSLENAEKSGFGCLLDIYTFDRFSTDLGFQKRLYDRAQKYLNENGNKWFAVFGKSGAGKSHICTAICKAFLEKGIEVRFISWLDTIRQLKAVANDPAYEQIIEPIKNAEVLYVDDFFKNETYAKPTPADIKIANEIFNYRYNKSRRETAVCKTLLSSEKSFFDIMEYDEAIAGRIYEMAGEFTTNLKEDAINYRLKNIKNC